MIMMQKELILKELSTKWMARNLIVKDETTSTNDDAARISKEGAANGSLVVADKQTKGRGRNGREWKTEKKDNIAMSLLLKPSFDKAKSPMLTLVMGLALAQGIESVCNEKVGIKWPNDIVLNKHKLCGILTEMHIYPGREEYDVVIGVGINVNQKKEDFAKEIADMAGSMYSETGTMYDRNIVIARVMEFFEKDYELFCKCDNLKFLKDEYESRLLNKGRKVKIIEKDEEFAATALGITDVGELIIQKEDGTKRLINSGEVSVRGLYGYV